MISRHENDGRPFCARDAGTHEIELTAADGDASRGGRSLRRRKRRRRRGDGESEGESGGPEPDIQFSVFGSPRGSEN